MENISDLWDRALEEIEKRVSKPSFETWLKSTKAHAIEDDLLIVTAPNEFARDWLENRYTGLIAEIIQEITGSTLEIKFITPQQNNDEEIEVKKPKKIPKINNTSNDSPKTMLNQKYTFDTFVIGSGNRFAHAASLAVAEAPAKAYNPLFI